LRIEKRRLSMKKQNRFRRTILSVLILFSLSLIVSCAGIPKPQNPGDTLLIIPVTFNLKPGTPSFGYYYSLEFNGVEKPILVSPTNAHYVAVAGMPAGKFFWKTITIIPIGSSGYAARQAQTYDAPDVAVETRENTATMAPFVIDSTMVESFTNHFQQSWKLRAVESADRQLILEELNRQDAFAAWENGLEN
jgi:hypothetical protein